MTRRKFLTIAGAGTAVAALTALGGYKYLGINEMKRPQPRAGKILADLHCHFPNDKDDESSLEALTSGLVGLTFIRGGEERTLTYEQALTRFSGIAEIDKGRLAQIAYNGKIGHIIKTQEVRVFEEIERHFLAVGLSEYLPNFSNSEDALNAIHKQGALAIYNHLYVTGNGDSFPPYRLITTEEEKKARELCQMVDEVEVFNAQNINTWIPGIPNMHEANDAAKVLAAEFGKKGTAASDARILEQVGISGIYLPEENLSLESIREQLRLQNFERAEQYVSRLSFAEGMFLR